MCAVFAVLILGSAKECSRHLPEPGRKKCRASRAHTDANEANLARSFSKNIRHALGHRLQVRAFEYVLYDIN